VRRTIGIAVCAGLFFLAAPARGAAPAAVDPAALLRDSDRARGAAASTAGVSWLSTVTTKDEEQTSEATYSIRVRGDDALAEVIAPPRQKGEKILFNDRTLWFFKPGLRKPVSISPRQKLMGDAANGDIASTHYARDYEATLAGEETVNGTPSWKLELKARARNVTYDRIRYWVSKGERLGVRAEFLTLAGEVFKSADFTYANSIQLAGATVPFVSEMVIRDSLNARRETVLRYQKPHVEPHAESLFNVNNLAR
jgi:outer membrane lipoprotein-sorting protein